MDVSDWAAAFEGKNVQQIVGFCGNGRLTNDSECSTEFCSYLEQQNEAKLFEHANYCLENSFDKSGYVLQDIVNEMGRRITHCATIVIDWEEQFGCSWPKSSGERDERSGEIA